MQQLTCNIDVSSSFYHLFFYFVLIETLCFERESPGDKKMRKSAKIVKRFSHFLVVAL